MPLRRTDVLRVITAANLRELELRNYDLTHAVIKPAIADKQLTSLALISCSMTNNHLTALTEARLALHTLRIDSCNVTDQGVCAFLESNPPLESLEMTGLTITDITLSTLARIGPKLHTLRVNECLSVLTEVIADDSRDGSYEEWSEELYELSYKDLVRKNGVPYSMYNDLYKV